MIRLTQPTSDLISLITAQNGAKTVAAFTDTTATTWAGSNEVHSITSATTTTIVATPAASTIREIDFINIYNTYAGAQLLTVQQSVSATLYILVAFTLLQGESLQYTHAGGWCALDVNGNRKEVTASVFSSLGVTGAATLSGALTYGGVALTNAVTGTGKMVLDTSPTIATPVINSAAHVGGTWVADATWTLPSFNTGTITATGNLICNSPSLFFGTTANNFTVNNSADILSIKTTDGTTRVTVTATGVTLLSLAGSGSRAVNADANGLLSAASDSRMKQEVQVKLPGLAEVMLLQPKAYKWIKDIKQRGDKAAIEIGFFAQQVAPIIPSAAPTNQDGTYGFYDRSITAALVKAIQELSASFDAYKASHI